MLRNASPHPPHSKEKEKKNACPVTSRVRKLVTQASDFQISIASPLFSCRNTLSNVFFYRSLAAGNNL